MSMSNDSTKKRAMTLFLIGGTGESFLDGFVLCIIGVALVQIVPFLQLNTLWSGLIGAASLAGLFLGSPTFGYLADVVGRRVIYRATPILIALLSIGQLFVTTPIELLVLRFAVGMIVGADYANNTSVMTEFCPEEKRSSTVAFAMVMWFVGATAADFVGYFFYDFGNGWQWMFGSTVVPATLLAILRWNVQESPRWLMNKGKIDKAREIMQLYDVIHEDDVVVSHSAAKPNRLMSKKYIPRVLFAGLFWACQVLPMFALYTFGPAILSELNLGQGKAALIGDSLISFLFLVGVAYATYKLNSIGRRTMIIGCFVFMTLGMAILWFFANGPLMAINIGFCIYALASGGPNALDWVYPNELFPTEIRAFGTGLATAISRIGAVMGTFAVPIWIADYGIQSTMLGMTLVTIIGLLVCIALAPETRGLSLDEAGDAPSKNLASVLEKGHSHT